MKKIFWLGITGLILFEILNVYFIMPMPGSQRMDSIDTAYFLYKWRWAFRAFLLLLVLVGLFRSKWKRKWVLVFPVLLVVAIAYMGNFKMSADHMFLQPGKLVLAAATDNRVDSQRLIIGVVNNGVAKAYPIQFMGYHHHVQDTVGGKPIMVTYCTVCRTGRVFEPIVNGMHETFRLVGMDHFNAMLEDATTKSWWRQVTGEAIAGKLKGQHLPEVQSLQTSLAYWLRLYPNSLIMQPDPEFTRVYDSTYKYENGTSRNSLTGTDSLSWKDKSWVIGVKAGNDSKAYDWNQLITERIILDKINKTPVLVVLAADNKGFFVFEDPGQTGLVLLNNDTITIQNRHYRLDGKGIDTSFSLKPLPASQEFWHSWKTFNPDTEIYGVKQ